LSGGEVLVWNFELVDVPGQDDPVSVRIAGWEFSGQIFPERKYRVLGKQKDGGVDADSAEDVDNRYVVKPGVGIPQWFLRRMLPGRLSRRAGEAQNVFPWTEAYPNGRAAHFWYFEVISEDATERHAARMAGSRCTGQIVNGNRYLIQGIERDGVVLVKEGEDLTTHSKVRCT
jgi:hypothetical protein